LREEGAILDSSVQEDPTMIHANRSIMCMAFALLMALAPAQITAQDAPEAPDRAELETFAEAYYEISQVRDEISPALAAAETAEEADALQQQANDEMMSILEDHDLTVERYASITQLLNQDEELRAEFEAIYAEISGLM
jgi:hypothetical protein